MRARTPGEATSFETETNYDLRQIAQSCPPTLKESDALDVASNMKAGDWSRGSLTGQRRNDDVGLDGSDNEDSLHVFRSLLTPI